MQSLFTYGSLMCGDIMFAVVGTPLQSAPALLPDYCRYAIKDEQYPGVVRGVGGMVSGIVYHGIGGKGWARLDHFEGEMYCRQPVVVRYPDESEEEVGCYIIKPEFERLLTEEAWDFDEFLSHGKKIFQTRYQGFRNMG